jgi:four helix bundle protein
MYRNKNRGYQQLRVWEDAIQFYVGTCRSVRTFPYELKRVAGQQIASADSVHRNIAEGYCRRSIKEYLQSLYTALGSLGESVSGLQAYQGAGQLAEADFQSLDSLAFKLENGLLRLVVSLERKRDLGDWIDHMVVKESNVVYGADDVSLPPLQCSSSPALHSSKELSP